MTLSNRERVAVKLGDDDQEQHMTGFHRKTCVMCKTQFVALRSDKVTCGARCRKSYERHCRKITKEMKEREAKQVKRFEQLCNEVTNNGD